MTLRVEISIIPFGNEEEKRVIETVNISNVGTRISLAEDEYFYVVEHNEYRNFDDDRPKIIHKRSDGAMILVEKALKFLNYREDDES